MANKYSLDLELGSTQYAYRADDADFDFTTALTLEGWQKVESLTADHSIMAKYDSSSQRAYRFFVLSTGALQVVFSDDGTTSAGHYQIYTTDTTPISTGTWFHVAVTFNVTTETCIFYVNGSPVANTKTSGTTLGASLHNSTAPLMVGADGTVASPGNHGDGLFNNMRAWNVVRSGADILANKNKVLTSGSGLVGAYYATINNHEDLTSNNNDLTYVTGSPVFSTDVPFTGFIPRIITI